MKGRIGICLAGLLALSGVAHSTAAEQKIGVVDMEKVLAAHPDTKEAESLIQKEIETFDQERKDQQDKFDKMRQDFEDARAESENRALSEEGRQAKRKVAERKLEEMRDFDEQFRQTSTLRKRQINDRKSRMRTRIVEDIRSVIREYSRKNGYNLVLDAGPLMESFGVVVYSVETMDLTDAVTKLLVETRKSTMSAPEKSDAGPAEKTTDIPSLLENDKE